MKLLKGMKNLSLIVALCFIVSCEKDNFTDPDDPRFGSTESVADTTGAETPSFATSNITTQVSIDPTVSQDISPLLFGVNNDWRRVTNGSYSTYQAALESINYTLIRYPGGFESEFYDWSENLTPDWPNRPNVPGATIETVMATNPNAVSIVVPIRLAMVQPLFSNAWNNAIAALQDEAIQAVNATGPGNITSLELGNEWWLQFAGQGVSREDKLIKYAEIAKRLARHIRLEFPSANFKVLVNGDYTAPEEFSVINRIFGSDIDDIDGTTLHTYTGYDSERYNITRLQQDVDDVQRNLGKSYLSLSEWAPSKLYNEGQIYAQGANLVVEQNYEHALTGAEEAAFWPPTNPGIPGLGLFSFNFGITYPTAQLFGDMAADFTGKVLRVTDGTVRGAAAQQADGTFVVYVTGKQVPFTTVTLDVGAEVDQVISATIWKPGNTSNTADAVPMIASENAPFFVSDNTILFNINQDSEYEIYKVVYTTK